MNKNLSFIEEGLLALFGLKVVTRRAYPRKKTIKVSKEKREQARVLVYEKLAHFNQFYNFSYNKVFIKNQKTRWGSCSSNGNLNFNWKIITLTPEAQDYLVVHELCHLKEFNHSQAFWDLVALQIPEYTRIRTTLHHID